MGAIMVSPRTSEELKFLLDLFERLGISAFLLSEEEEERFAVHHELTEAGEAINGYLIDFNRIKIEALDAMKLSKGGIVVPESAIYYDDNDTAYDEDFEGDWVRAPNPNHLNLAQQTEVKINLQSSIKQWVESNDVKLDQLIETLLDNFYHAQKMVSKEP